MRFDLFAAQELNISRNKASELIKEGKILLNGEAQTKPSIEVSEDSKINLTDEIYVSRGALKLKSFLSEYDLEILGKTALDIGSSTGGFTQILLLNGAAKITALDVGSDQLDVSLRMESKITLLENCDIRKFQSKDKFDIITCDVAFISVLEILKDIDRLAGGDIIILFKPQFEVGLGIKRNKKGVVKDEKAIAKARAEFEIEAANLGWILRKSSECEVKGKEGNAEFFYAFNKR